MADNRTFFILRVRNTEKVKALLERGKRIPRFVFEQDKLERLLLRRTLRRFDAEEAQSGAKWPAITNKAYGEKKADKPLLVDTGALRENIKIIRRNMGPAKLRSPTGGGFSIGVEPGKLNPKGVPVEDYARLHNFGIGQIRRQFLGISTSDVASVNDWMYRCIKRAGL